ncbi:MAG: PEP-CTERM sorting domain-containing protein [Okeania sp. SIO2C9]|nr:PEP-CTERM sorting domain-containing protein [Okeania sp. SIO2C9]
MGFSLLATRTDATHDIPEPASGLGLLAIGSLGAV